MHYDVQQINHLIRNRRSIKPEKYNNKREVPSFILDEMLENANWAPNHGLNQPWHFVIFKGDGRRKLAEFQANHYKINTPPETFKQGKYEKQLNRPEMATYVIAICMKRVERTRIPVIEDVEAVACAVQNMHLTAAAYGVAGYWTSGGVTYTQALKDWLGLGEEDQCLGFFYVGYTDEPWPESPRKSMDDKVVWVDK